MNKYNLKKASLLSLVVFAGLSAEMTQDEVLAGLKSKLETVTTYFNNLKEQAEKAGLNVTDFQKKVDVVKEKLKSANIFDKVKLGVEEAMLKSKLKGAQTLKDIATKAKDQLGVLKSKFETTLNSFKGLSEKDKTAALKKAKDLLNSVDVEKGKTSSLVESASNWFNKLIGNTTETAK